jgi:hypothetical protein
MHYQVWKKDDKEKTVEIWMRFIDKEQAIRYFENAGLTLLNPKEANWPNK